jgi:hypothetical protein
VYITETAKERIANTLVWYLSHVVMPKTSSVDAATAAARDLIYALQNPHPAAPIAPLADEHRKGLQNLAEIFQQVATPRATSEGAFRRRPTKFTHHCKISEGATNRHSIYLRRSHAQPRPSPTRTCAPEQATNCIPAKTGAH